MKQAVRLLMSFKAINGKTVTLGLDEPRSDVNETEIKGTMQLILDKNVFAPAGSNLSELVGAKVVQTQTTDYDLLIVE